MSNASNSVTVICYRQSKVWNSRDEAIAFYREAVASSDGSEQERYENILSELVTGKNVCSDEPTD